MNCILSRAISYHYQCRCPPTKEETLLCSTCLELLSGCSRSFLVFLAQPSLFWLVTTYSRLLHLLQTTIYKMFWLANLQKMSFMSGIVTKWGKCYYKMGSFLFYKTGQVLLQSKVGITEWHSFYNKISGGSISNWGNHYKEQKDCTKAFWQLSFRATFSESKINCNCKKLRGGAISNWWTSFSNCFFFLSQSTQNTWKSSSIVIQFHALKS